MTDLVLNYHQKYVIETTVTNLQTAGGLSDFAHLIFTVKGDLDDSDSAAKIQKKTPEGPGAADLFIQAPGSGPSPAVNGILWTTIHTTDYTKITAGIESLLYWDIVAIDSSGEEYLLDSGTLTVLAHASQSTS